MRNRPRGLAGWLARRLPNEIVERCLLPVYYDAHADYVATAADGWRLFRPLRLVAFHVRVVIAALQCLGLALSTAQLMVLQDVRFAVRMLAKNPGFTAIAGIALALGIGANTAMFSIVHAVVLRPLPYRDPARVVAIAESARGALQAVSPPNYVDWKLRNRTLDGIAAYQDGAMTLGGSGAPERLPAGFVAANLFEVLGVSPTIGRGFLPQDERLGAEPTVVLGYALWQSRFGGDATIVGRMLRFEGLEYRVAGVMPRGFTFPGDIGLWFPLVLTERDTTDNQRGAHYLSVIGRLKPDITVAQAFDDLSAIERAIAARFPTVRGNGVWLQPLLDSMVGDVKRPLFMLLGAVGFVLLIACANISNLLLARATGRRAEVALRSALGASRWRIVRQLLIESVVLSTAGGVAGVLVAAWSIRVLSVALPEDLPRTSDVQLNLPILVFSLIISILTGILFGLAPAVYGSATDVAGSLRDAGRDGIGGGGRKRLRGTLVASEIALALVLLAGAGLALRSFDRLHRVDPGFDASNVLTWRVALAEARYPDTASESRFFTTFVDRLASQPGVVAAGGVMVPPLSSNGFGGTFTIIGRADGDNQRMQVRPATPGYFEALRIPIRRGRALATADGATAQHVAVISDEAARRFFRGEDPIGKHIRIHVSVGVPEKEREIVGVVGDVKMRTMEAAPAPVVYVPQAQYVPDAMTIFVRTAGDPMAFVSIARSELARLDPEIAMTGVRPATNLIAASVAQPRFRTALLGLFALMAVALAAVGLYGVMAYSVSQRRSELGLRLALGADRSDVIRLVLRQGLQPVAAGIAAGLLGATLLSQLAASMMFEISVFDPVTFLAAPLVLAAVAVAACYAPARRATRVDPVTALRG